MIEDGEVVIGKGVLRHRFKKLAALHADQCGDSAIAGQ